MLYIIRMTLVAILFILGGAIGVIIGVLRPFNPSNVYPVARILSTIGLKLLGIKVVVENQQIIKENHPCILISNHQENLDIFPCSYILPPRAVSLGKNSLKWIPIFGQFYWLSGNILIDRSNKKKALQSMKNVADAIKNRNTSLWVMPEGTRSKGRGVLPFKKGAFHTAIGAQANIIPICLSSYHKNLNLNKWNAGTIRIRVLDPIRTQGLEKSDVTELTLKAQALISDNVKELDSL